MLFYERVLFVAKTVFFGIDSRSFFKNYFLRSLLSNN